MKKSFFSSVLILLLILCFATYSSIVKAEIKITPNTICCDQEFSMNSSRDPSQIFGSYVQADGATVTYRWETSIGRSWRTVSGNPSTPHYDPPQLSNTTFYRRIVIVSGQEFISNQITITINECASLEVCGDRVHYSLTFGTVFRTPTLNGPDIGSSTPGRDYDYQWRVSYDQGASWSNVGRGRSATAQYKNLSLSPFDVIFDKWYGTKEIWLRRDYAEYYDDWSCNFLGLPAPCGADWHEKSQSNVVKITLTTFSNPDDLIVDGPSTITCTGTYFLAQLYNYYDMDLGNIASVVWSVDNPDWAVEPGAGIWGAFIQPFAFYNTGRSDQATVKALITTKQGRTVTRTLKVVGPPQPSMMVNASSMVLCSGKPITVTVTTDVANTVSFSAPGLTLGAVSKVGNVTTLNIPVAQQSNLPETLVITATSANQCKTQKTLTIYTRSDAWLQDRPWTGPSGPQLTAQDDTFSGRVNNFVEEQKHNIYYVGFTANNLLSNTLLTLQWDASANEWRNFAFPKSNPVNFAAGPLAIFEDVNHIRTIYYVSSFNKINYIKSLGGYVDEYNATSSNWTLPASIIINHEALDMLTPLSDGRVVYRATDQNLYVTSASGIDNLLVSNVKGSNCFTLGNGLFYVSSTGQIRQINTLTFTDIPGNYNNVYVHPKSGLAYSFTTNRFFAVNASGRVVLYNLVGNTIYTYGGWEKASAQSITVNKATGVLYFSGTNSDPAQSNGIAYQCFYNAISNSLQVKLLNPIVKAGGYSNLSSTLLYTDFNLFFVSKSDNKVYVDYFLSGTNCGPVVTRESDGKDTPADALIPVKVERISIVPNPNAGTGELYFETAEYGNVQALVYNTQGEQVYASEVLFHEGGAGVLSLQCDPLVNGLYLVRFVQNGNIKSAEKLLIQK